MPNIENVALRRGITTGTNLAVLIAVALLAASSSTAAAWRPLPVIAMLLAFSVASDSLAVPLRGIRISGEFPAFVLAMVLLGPAPAAAIGIATAVVDAVLSRPKWEGVLTNVATYGAFPLAGGFLMHVLQGPH